MASESQPAVAAPASAPAPVPAIAPPPASLSTDARSSERGSRAKSRSRPPFRLCFTIPGVPGRTQLPPEAAAGAEKAVNIIAGKFHTREEEKIRAQLQEIARAEELAERLDQQMEREHRRDRHLLESHQYGLYPTPLVPPPVADRRLHFGIRTSDMVRIQCEIARAPPVGPSSRVKASKAPIPQK